jgi:hypothetical protein
MSQSFEMTLSRGQAEYQIRHYDEGVVFFSHSGIPVSVVASLGKLVPGPDSKKLIAINLHPYLKKILGASVVYAIAQNEATLRAWEDRVEEEIAAMKNLSIVDRWLIGLDTGTSSKTMVKAAFPNHNITSEFSIPHDPDDFGRCMRAVDYFTSAMGTEDPDIRKRFLDPENYKDKGHHWSEILAKWDELCAVARQAGLSKRRGKFSNSHCEVLYKMLQQIEYPAL